MWQRTHCIRSGSGGMCRRSSEVHRRSSVCCPRADGISRRSDRSSHMAMRASSSIAQLADKLFVLCLRAVTVFRELSEKHVWIITDLKESHESCERRRERYESI